MLARPIPLVFGLCVCYMLYLLLCCAVRVSNSWVLHRSMSLWMNEYCFSCLCLFELMFLSTLTSIPSRATGCFSSSLSQSNFATGISFKWGVPHGYRRVDGLVILHFCLLYVFIYTLYELIVAFLYWYARCVYSVTRNVFKLSFINRLIQKVLIVSCNKPT